ncbi:MAG TPA: phenylalanine--tRNA ligase beta subunit-related protein [Candidatus Obscuribacterales bacterium]
MKLRSALEQLVAERAIQEFPSQSDKDTVRNLLRTSAFKPTGRNKPASEYLAQAAREGRFPFINNLVDINNYVSLRTGLPISLLDTDVVGDTLILRHGREGERYVFNATGQDIDLHGLICACAGAADIPLGNPVKDSVAGKIKDSTTNVIGVIYSPDTGELAELARKHAQLFADLLETEGHATETRVIIA